MAYRIALLGGSYDPVHLGHVALGEYFANLLQVDQLRVIPTGLPWQKASLKASSQQRADMVALAFAGQPFSVAVDMQEIARRPGAADLHHRYAAQCARRIGAASLGGLPDGRRPAAAARHLA